LISLVGKARLNQDVGRNINRLAGI